MQRYQAACAAADVPLVACNGALYHDPERRYLHDVLTAIRLKCTVAELGADRLHNSERHLKSGDDLCRLFAACPDAVARTLEVADRCTFSLDELRYEYPEELAPEGQTPLRWLNQLTWEGARNRYPDGIPPHVREPADSRAETD